VCVCTGTRRTMEVAKSFTRKTVSRHGLAALGPVSHSSAPVDKNATQNSQDICKCTSKGIK
jgi:hypothetical protein